MECAKKKADVEEVVRRVEEGLVPDEELRRLIRIQIAKRLQWGYRPTQEEQLAEVLKLTKSLRRESIAARSDTLNAQAYELPISFLKLMLGKTLKSSCCYFKDKTTSLDEAEIAMIDLYCERAQMIDGQRVLDLGCGQGAVTLHIAQKYKNCHVTAITNSVSQKDFIKDKCKELQLSNVEVILADIIEHEMDATFDRIIVIELFEHMKNFELLLRKISNWMKDDGLLFIDHLCHRTLAYQDEPIDEDDWYTEYVFPSGTLMMPSASFFLYFQDDVSVVDHWTLNGKHLAQSSEEWLKKLDGNRDKAKEIMESIARKENAEKLINYWRVFCIAGSEFFGYRNGEEWMVSHVLFKKKC